MTAYVFAMYVSTFFISDIYSNSAQSVPGRDDWYKTGLKYDDLPRVFSLKDGCPAKEFYLDCNMCSCRDSNEPACTYKACPQPPQIVNWRTGKSCPAGQHFYWKCNDCSCEENGREASCTRNFCPDFGDSPSQ
ncbi:hypothetical protein TSAR_012006 [Trichomalopsis sarcophagae]|uniref:Pacifastin domain-containing protein n=1 Tax=Trichomalopsis sarcophagae TaxID=543379 RepID=A0A232F505_9HYME|nr:hypothetical protein TSAR_012006 [Trichomalopsis sarcophagae]